MLHISWTFYIITPSRHPFTVTCNLSPYLPLHPQSTSHIPTLPIITDHSHFSALLVYHQSLTPSVHRPLQSVSCVSASSTSQGSTLPIITDHPHFSVLLCYLSLTPSVQRPLLCISICIPHSPLKYFSPSPSFAQHSQQLYLAASISLVQTPKAQRR